ncbi:DNA polymerase III subunit gamma/tau [Patescibacteria group bacterium]|nr:DNA polymerase III subunit gamma/tau [Patescibacteria group bacterium]
MTLALYRKYRPSSFSELVGQNHIKVTLQNELANGRVTHAYLFTGPRGIGKTTTARLLAKAVNCQKMGKDGESCDKCDFCQEIIEGRSIDLIEIDAASHTGVDNVRENIIDNARFAPSRLPYKVFIIDEVHMLSISAFNALLKILEEPPSHVIFILATTEVHKLPDTIISRCQRFDFKKINYADIVDRLNRLTTQEKVKVDKSILQMIARRSDGSIRDAESVLGQILALGEKEITKDQAMLILPRSDTKLVIELIGQIIKNDLKSGIDLVNRLLEEGVNLIQFNYELIEFLRKLILIKVVGSLDTFSALEFDKSLEEKILELSEQTQLDRLVTMIDTFILVEKELKSATDIPQLPLELAVIKLCQGAEIEIIEKDDEKPSSGNNTQAPPAKTRAVKNPPKKSSIGGQFVEMEKNWKKAIKELSKKNQSLSLMLKTCQLADFEGDTAMVGVAYQFHRDQLMRPEKSKIVEDCLAEITGSKVKVKFVLVKAEAKTPQVKTNVFDNVLQTFGGKVVD